MSKKSIIFLFLLILFPVIIYFLWPSDEARIKKLIREGARAVEKEDIDKVMSKVSFNYQDDYGGTYMLIKDFLSRQFRTMSDIKVEYENLKVEAKEDTAVAELDLRVVATIGNDTGYYVGDIKNPVRLKIHLEKEHTKWLVTKTEGLKPNI